MLDSPEAMLYIKRGKLHSEIQWMVYDTSYVNVIYMYAKCDTDRAEVRRSFITTTVRDDNSL